MPYQVVQDKSCTVEGASGPYVKLFTAATPNGFKISILLELLGLDYYVRPVDVLKGENKEEWYLELNPSGKIPFVSYVNENNEVLKLSESAAILMFLVDKFDNECKYSFANGSDEYYRTLEMMFFQMAELGPRRFDMFWYSFVASQKDDFAIQRSYNESVRCFYVLEKKLQQNGTGFLVGNHLSIADVCCYPWVNGKTKFKELENCPELTRWIQRLESIPEIQSAYKIPGSL